MDDSRSQTKASGADSPVRGLHTSEHHVSPCKTGIHAVVHVLHVEKYEGGIDGIPDGIDANRSPRVLPAQPLAQHAGHSARIPPAWRQAGLYGAPCAGSNVGSELRGLRAGGRTLRKTGP